MNHQAFFDLAIVLQKRLPFNLTPLNLSFLLNKWWKFFKTCSRLRYKSFNKLKSNLSSSNLNLVSRKKKLEGVGVTSRFYMAQKLKISCLIKQALDDAPFYRTHTEQIQSFIVSLLLLWLQLMFYYSLFEFYQSTITLAT